MASISFVIPTYNFAAFLPETLDSIIAEGYSSIEIMGARLIIPLKYLRSTDVGSLN